jgi:hypothetical protein
MFGSSEETRPIIINNNSTSPSKKPRSYLSYLTEISWLQLFILIAVLYIALILTASPIYIICSHCLRLFLKLFGRYWHPAESVGSMTTVMVNDYLSTIDHVRSAIESIGCKPSPTLSPLDPQKLDGIL